MLTADDIALIRQQFCRIEPFGYAFGAEFFARLFWSTPQARHCFPKDIFAARGKLVGVIGLAAEQLEQIDRLIPVIEALLGHPGHAKPTAEIHVAIGSALLDTLQSRLEHDFTDAARVAWSSAFSMVADVAICPQPMHAALEAA